MLSIAQARVNLLGDHLWLLQTDPLSLRRYDSQVLNGELGEVYTVLNRNIETASKLMEDAVDFWKWKWILQEIQKIQDLHTRH